eukprot:scaffold12689_cov51-Cylindrotheca_fusiformis.AAC.1
MKSNRSRVPSRRFFCLHERHEGYSDIYTNDEIVSSSSRFLSAVLHWCMYNFPRLSLVSDFKRLPQLGVGSVCFFQECLARYSLLYYYHSPDDLEEWTIVFSKKLQSYYY